ncbi:inositol 1,4,5-trisphosphate-sensitive calcium-release channel [Aureococcus anophagefferens]|nr:inositol 1,4,5-trisphosphate-sensitive calcium-release channel [Aureococcus anophagefferens]
MSHPFAAQVPAAGVRLDLDASTGEAVDPRFGYLVAAHRLAYAALTRAVLAHARNEDVFVAGRLPGGGPGWLDVVISQIVQPVGAPELLTCLVSNNVRLISRIVDAAMVRRFAGFVAAYGPRPARLPRGDLEAGFRPIHVRWRSEAGWAPGRGALFHGPAALGLESDGHGWVLLRDLAVYLDDAAYARAVGSYGADPGDVARAMRLRQLAAYYVGQVELLAELCRDRSYNAIAALEAEYTFGMCLWAVVNGGFPGRLRAAFATLLLHLHVVKYPHQRRCGQAVLPQRAWVAERLVARGDAFDVVARFDPAVTFPDADVGAVAFSADKFHLLKVFVAHYLDDGATQVMVADEPSRTLVTLKILNVVEALVDFGFYSNAADLRALLAIFLKIGLEKPLLACLLNDDVPAGDDAHSAASFGRLVDFRASDVIGRFLVQHPAAQELMVPAIVDLHGPRGAGGVEAIALRYVQLGKLVAAGFGANVALAESLGRDVFRSLVDRLADHLDGDGDGDGDGGDGGDDDDHRDHLEHAAAAATSRHGRAGAAFALANALAVLVHPGPSAVDVCRRNQDSLHEHVLARLAALPQLRARVAVADAPRLGLYATEGAPALVHAALLNLLAAGCGCHNVPNAVAVVAVVPWRQTLWGLLYGPDCVVRAYLRVLAATHFDAGEQHAHFLDLHDDVLWAVVLRVAALALPPAQGALRRRVRARGRASPGGRRGARQLGDARRRSAATAAPTASARRSARRRARSRPRSTAGPRTLRAGAADGRRRADGAAAAALEALRRFLSAREYRDARLRDLQLMIHPASARCFAAARMDAAGAADRRAQR